MLRTDFSLFLKQGDAFEHGVYSGFSVVRRSDEQGAGR